MPETSARAAAVSWRWSIAPGSEPALAAWKLGPGPGTDLPDALARAELVDRNRGREVRRLADPERADATLYLKFFERGRASAARRESAALATVAARLERLEEGRARPRIPPLLARATSTAAGELLVLGEVAGRALHEWMAAAPAIARRRVSEALGRAIAALHEVRVVHRQLFAWHVRVHGDGQGACDGAPGLLDLAESVSRARPLSIGERAQDLAALFATVDRSFWSLAERARFLAAYEPDRARRRRLVTSIRSERLRLLRRARVPRSWPHREWRVEGERLLVAESASAPAELARATRARDWIAPDGAECVRTRDGRSNLVWSEPLGLAGRRWFGKRFEREPWRGRALAFREFLALRALAAAGVRTPSVVAVARRDGERSVLWTEGVRPGKSLRELLPSLGSAGRWAPERGRLLHEAAATARRLHGAGFAHGDLYLDHFLVEEQGNMRRLVVIDATRVRLHARLPERARAKDLAQLEFSARAAGASRSERWRALLVYARGDRALACSLARAAVRKADRIARHERRHGRPAPAA